jgi:hypothetical protein
MLKIRRLKNKAHFIIKFGTLSLVGVGYWRIKANLSTTQGMTANKPELIQIVRKSTKKPMDINLLGFRSSSVSENIVFVKADGGNPKPNSAIAKPGLGRTSKGRISMPRLKPGGKPTATPKTSLKRGVARAEAFSSSGRISRLPTRVSTSLGAKLNDKPGQQMPENDAVLAQPSGNPDDNPGGSNNNLEEEFQCPKKKDEKKNSIDHEGTGESRKENNKDDEVSNTSDDEQETDIETDNEQETAHDKAIRFLEANSNRQLTEQEIEEQHHLFMEECEQRNINVVASVERFKQLVTERGKVDANTVYEGRTALFAEGLGFCKNIRRCSDSTLDIDFEYSTDTNKIGLLDAKVGRDISYIPRSKFWKNPPSHQEIFTGIGEKLMIQKQRVKQYDSSKYDTEVLHVISLERIKSMPERINLKQDVLEGIRQQGTREIHKGAMTNSELQEAISATEFINYK